MLKKLHLLAFLLCLFLFIACNLNIAHAAGKPAPPWDVQIVVGSVPGPDPGPAPSNGLLSSMTPGNYQIPSGWTLVRTQDFENGCRSDEDCGRANGSIGTTKPHSGKYSVEGNYSSDQSEVGWKLYNPRVTFNEIYASFWEYTESQALWNDEYFLFNLMKKDGDGNILQSWIVDWYWGRDDKFNLAYNGTNMTLYNITESVGGGGVEWTDYSTGRTESPPKGSWVQWEIWWRANSIGQNDGFARVYKNGSFYLGSEKKNTRGSVNMDNPDFISLGGLYTKLVWMYDYPDCTQCAIAPGHGNSTDACMGSKGWWGQSFSNPVCAPQDPPMPSFKRYIDDIIVMKR